MPYMKYYYSTVGSNVVGPHSLAELSKLLVKGAIPPHTLVCKEGSESWILISEVLDFRPGKPEPNAVGLENSILENRTGASSSNSTVCCPMCGETILKAAKKCKHCGEYLEKNDEEDTAESSKRLLTALLLCLFLGGVGGHALYAGQTGQGIIYIALWICVVVLIGSANPLWTYPAIFIGVFEFGDLIRIISGEYKDGNGKKITKQ